MTWFQWIRHRLTREGQHLWGAYDRWTKDDGWLMAAAVSYYVGLSFFPLLAMLLAAFGMFLRFTKQGEDARETLLTLAAQYMSSGLEENVAAALELVETKAMFSGPLALGGVVVAAMAGFVYFERAFDRIWGVTQVYRTGIVGAIVDVLIRRAVAFVLLLAFAIILVGVFLAGLILSALHQYTQEYLQTPESLWNFAQSGITILMNLLMFTLLYRWLSKVKVRWREALRGGVAAALFWEIGRLGLTMYLVNTSYGSAYGVIGSFIVIQLWCYYAVAVIFFGAEYIQEFCRYCDGERTGIHATSAADPEPPPAKPAKTD